MASDETEEEITIWDNQFKEDVKSGRFFWLTNKHVMDFKKGHFKDFWIQYDKLSKDTQRLADETFLLLKDDPNNPSLQLIIVGRYWSIQIGKKYRALGIELDKDGLLWCWLGSFSEYSIFLEAINKGKV
jgi:hypothetical protein